MSLKDEMREVGAVAMERSGRPDIAKEIRAGETSYYVGTAVNAALSVCDEYEEVDLPSFTVYRKKEKPEPTLLEAADAFREAVDCLADMRNKDAVVAWQGVYHTRDTLAAAIAKEK